MRHESSSAFFNFFFRLKVLGHWQPNSFMALGINQVTYSNRKFYQSVGPGFATLGTSR